MKSLAKLILAIFLLLPSALIAKPEYIPNRGQWSEEVLYKCAARGLNIWITREGLVFDHFAVKSGPSRPDFGADSICGTAYKFSFISKNKEQKLAAGNIIEIGEKGTTHNYFVGANPKAFKAEARDEIILAYTDFSVRLYSEGEAPRYDVALDENYSPDDLQIKYQGEAELTQNSESELKILSPYGEFAHGGLKAYQGRNQIKCAFNINNGDIIKFKFDTYNKNEKLIIDPVVFSTFFGGVYSWGDDVCVSERHNPIIVLGTTDKLFFPDSLKNYDIANQDYETVIFEFDRDGDKIYRSSHLPKIYDPKIFSLKDGSYKMIGITKDSMPVGSSAFAGNCDRKFNGTAYLYSCNFNNLCDSIYNGSFWGVEFVLKRITDIESDDMGNIYMVGLFLHTDTSIIITDNAFRKEWDQDKNGFLIAMDSVGSNYLISSYWGNDTISSPPYGILLSEDKLYVTGLDIYPGLNAPCYFSAINLKSWEILYHKTMHNNGYGLDLIKVNNYLYIIGESYSEYFNEEYRTTKGAHKARKDDDYPIFISVFDENTLTDTIRATFSSNHGIQELVFAEQMPDGELVLGGKLQCGYLDITDNAFIKEKYNQGEYRGFFMIISQNLDSVIYCTYIGGSGFQSELRGIEQDELGRFYLCGWTDSRDFPMVNPYIRYLEPGKCSAFILAIEGPDYTEVGSGETPRIAAAPRPNPARAGEEIILSCGAEFSGAASLGIYDISGKSVYSEALFLFGAELQDIRLRLPAGLARGAYIIKLSCAEAVKEWKIMAE